MKPAQASRSSTILIIGMALAAACLARLGGYLLFHSLVETFTVAVACSIFFLAWNARSFLDNDYHLLIGIASLFVGALDLLHALAYKGMGVFGHPGADLPTQLWIAARFLQSLSFAAAPLFVRRKLDHRLAFSVFALASLALAGLIFGGRFPACYTEAGGLTPFKVISEYAIILLLLGAAARLRSSREMFERGVYRLLEACILLTAAAELAFTFYQDVYGGFNMAGHLLRFVAFCLLYRALIVTGLVTPNALLFRNLARSESELRKSESWLRSLSDNLPEAAIYRYRQDADGKPHMDLISAGVEKLTGISAREFLSDASVLEQNLDPEDRERLSAAIVASREGLAPFEVELRQKHRASGEVRWALLRSIPARNPDGSTTWDGVFLDITARKRAEQAQQASERRLRLATDAARIGAFDWDIQTGVNVWTPQLEAIYGLAPGEFARTQPGWEQLVHPEDRAGAVAKVQETLSTGATVEHEWRILWPDGSTHWISGRFQALKDEAGKPVRMTGINVDITDRKRAEEALRQSETRYRLLHESLRDPFVQTSMDGRIMDCNELYCGMLGYPLEEVRTLTYREITPERWHEFEARIVTEQIIARGYSDVYQKEYRRKDGTVFPVELRTILSRDAEGRPNAMWAVVRDISERKREEERQRQAQKLESLGLLAGGIAHDFNNLLVGVIGNASLAQDMVPPDHPVIELLETVVKTGEQAAHLTRQMLAYSGKGKFLVELLDLSTLVADLIELVRPSIPKKVVMNLLLGENLPAIEADRGQVQQIFMNLAINAAEAIGNHDGLITITTGTQVVDEGYLGRHAEAAELAPGEYVLLEVRDTGCGMDGATRAKIFDPFFSTKFTGRGLGLAAVAGIVRGHKGAIVVTTAPGKGTTFAVLFPPAARKAVRAGLAPVKAVEKGMGAVLVIDDEPVVRSMAEKALERQGYTVLAADGGLAAIDLLKRHPGKIDLAVLDLSMPGMSGEETLPELRKIRPDIKVVVSSGYSESEAMRVFGGQRVSGYLQKPYTSAALAEEVKRALG